jgi:hypothetical protein
LEPLTFCVKTDNNKINKRAKPNSQGRQKSKNKNQTKPSGAKTNKTKGYTLPKSEKFLDRNQVSYTPWTELQKKKFAELIEKANPEYVEVKAYMHVGFSRQRLQRENMPLIDEVVKFSEDISKHCNYTLIDSAKESRVVLLKRNC